jgi:hypothetical protein
MSVTHQSHGNLYPELNEKQFELARHPLFQRLTNLKAIQIFMQYHVFAVWDFMSLLKRLQNDITCTQIPWRPSVYSGELVRLINEIVLGEESDENQNEETMSPYSSKAMAHFQLYLKAMEEVGADTRPIYYFLENLDEERLPEPVKEFVQTTLQVAKFSPLPEVAATFFFGREKPIPSMFEAMVQTLEKEKISAPTFIYYLKRHIFVDGEDHGPKSETCLHELAKHHGIHHDQIIHYGSKALMNRYLLWDKIEKATLNFI